MYMFISICLHTHTKLAEGVNISAREILARVYQLGVTIQQGPERGGHRAVKFWQAAGNS